MGVVSFAGLVAVLTALAGPADPPEAKPAGAVLRVTGKVPKPRELTASDLERLPRQTATVRGRDGKDLTFEGVALAEVLKAAGLNVTPDELRGPALEYYLVAEASDGYRVVFALPELSAAFTDRVVLLADRRDGKPLGRDEGPLRLVVPDEKRQARWVRQVTTLKVGHD